MNWKQQWIDVILKDVPTSSYRKRLEVELQDHLETQCRALMEAGRTEDGARWETVRLMGEPDKLQKEYQAAWKRTWESKVAAVIGFLGASVLGVMILFLVYDFMFLIPAGFNSGVETWGVG